MTILTKSLYISGLQCPKLLWIKIHDSKLIPKPDESQQHIFDQGAEVGRLAQSLFPKGKLIKADYWDYVKSNELSRQELGKKKPLFEAGFLVNNIYARADILIPVGKEWDLIEIKSGTGIEDINYQDVAFQKYVYEKAGLKIRKCFLMHINNEYIRKGKINPKQLFKKEDITKQVNETILGIDQRIAGMFRVIESKTCPDIKIGPQCSDPYDCSLHDYCWKHIPLNSVFDMYRLGKKAFELYDSGVINIGSIPDSFKLNPKQMIQHRCVKCGAIHENRKEISNFLSQLKYPLYFMDFETYASAVPLYNKLKPYQNIPFQFSVHVIKREGVRPQHFSFLAEGSKDPRKKFIERLKKVLGTSGSIIVYNQVFEISRLKELAELFPKHKAWVESILDRIVDLICPFRNFDYYNPKQQGSCSLKDVLPALTGKSYEGMPIAEGEMASLKFLYMSHGDKNGKFPDKKEVAKIRKELEEYCSLDTMAEIMIIEKLIEIIK